MALEQIFKPKKKYKIQRIGGMYDGGYLVGDNSLKKTKILVSFGIGFDWQFEKQFAKINNDLKVWCYDENLTLNYLIKQFVKEIIFLPIYRRSSLIKCFQNIIEFLFLIIIKKFRFYKKKISYGDLDKILINKNNIFLKVDIEGSEYRILNEIILNQRKIIGLTIEFHDFNYQKNIIIDFIKRLNLCLIHIHPNNYGGKDINGDPKVIELTFERHPIVEGHDNILPHKLDNKNNPLGEDINLIFLA